MKPAAVTHCAGGSLRFFLYNTPCQVLADVDDEALAGALEAAQRVQSLLDVYDPGSALSRLNRAPAETPVAVEPELFGLLSELKRAHALSGGAYDPTLGPVSVLWNFGGHPRLPAAAELVAALAETGLDKLELDAATQSCVKTRPGLRLDAGGAGKGYAAGRIRDHLLAKGATRASINLGGNLCTIGHAPPWRVGIQRPWQPSGQALGVLELPGCSISTSCGCERFFFAGGRLCHHLLDPRTGQPANAGIASATLVSGSPLWADILSTVFFVGGAAAGKAALEALAPPGPNGWVLLMEDGRVEAAPALKFERTG